MGIVVLSNARGLERHIYIVPASRSMAEKDLSFEKAAENWFLRVGCILFSIAILALGIETLLCAHSVCDQPPFFPHSRVAPVIPWFPANSSLAGFFGAILIGCGIGLLFRCTRRVAALWLAGLLFLAALFLELPEDAANLTRMTLRTGVFETLSLASLALLLLPASSIPHWLQRTSRHLLGLSFVIFGVDHFVLLTPIGRLIPSWIPWHAFWIGFFGVGFIAAGLGVAFNVLRFWAAAAVGLMFAIWVITLHGPRVIGLYGVPGAPHNPSEWSGFFIALALWGGSWALAGNADLKS